jgi:hypothetical protein
MQPITIAIISFLCIFGGAVLGLVIQGFLPEHHLKPESKDAVKLGAGLIATMSALVLGILVGAAKGSFDSVNTSITQASARYLYIDRLLASYGPEAAPIRGDLRKSVEHIIERIWPEEVPGAAPGQVPVSSDMENVLLQMHALPEDNPTKSMTKSEGLKSAHELLLYRWLVLEQGQSTLPPLLLGVLLFWLTALNLTYALFAPRNGTVVTVLFVCALSVACALFVIEELDRPLNGLIKVPSTPFREALDYLGK